MKYLSSSAWDDFVAVYRNSFGVLDINDDSIIEHEQELVDTPEPDSPILSEDSWEERLLVDDVSSVSSADSTLSDSPIQAKKKTCDSAPSINEREFDSPSPTAADYSRGTSAPTSSRRRWQYRFSDSDSDSEQDSPSENIPQDDNLPPYSIRLTTQDTVMQAKIDSLGNSFRKTTDAALLEAGISGAKSMTAVRKSYLSNRIKNAIRQKRIAGHAVATAVDDSLTKFEAKYKDTKLALQRDLKKERDNRFHGVVEELSNAFSDSNSRGAWKIINKLTSEGCRSTDGLPIKNLDGVLLTEQDSILAGWAEYWADLANDKSGLSRCSEDKHQRHWDNVFEQRAKRYRRLCKETRVPDLTYRVMCEAFWRPASGKATGLSGISGELLQACLPSKRELRRKIAAGEPIEPENKAAEALFLLSRTMLRKGTIPTKDQVWSVVAIFKKGDKTLPSNYRGISLIEITIKMLTTVVTIAVQNGLEKGDAAGPFFTPEQGGFRAHREGVAQFVALWEICQRRKTSGVPTYCIWYDQKKAFDKVGHVAALTKLKETGMSETSPKDLGLRFIRGLYRSGKLSARVQNKASEFKDYLCGVRQGCPFSPTFYLVFINDIFDSLKDASLGVSVPGWPQDLAHFTEQDLKDGILESVVGLLFADDMCAIVSSLAQVKRVTSLVDNWGTKWEMSFGISKCGIAVIEPDISDEDVNDWLNEHYKFGEDDTYSLPPLPPHGALFQELLHANIRTKSGELIPIVEEYEYLGLKFNCWLNKRIVVEDRRVKGARALSRLRRFIGSNCYPIYLRAMAVSSMLSPVLTYGAEHFGMEDLEQPLEDILTNAVGMIIKRSWEIYTTRKRNPVGMNVAIDRVYMELGITSIKSISSAARARGLVAWRKKDGVSHSVMSQLLSFPVAFTPVCSKTRVKMNTIIDPKTWEGRGLEWLKGLLKWATSAKGTASLELTGVSSSNLEELSIWVKNPLLLARSTAGAGSIPKRWSRPIATKIDHQDVKVYEKFCRFAPRLVKKMEHVRKAYKSAGWLKDVAKPADERLTSVNNTIRYVSSGANASARLLRKIGLGYPKLGRGFHWIHRIRVGGFLRFKDAERCGYPPSLKIHGGGIAKCPCCLFKNGTSDDLEHFLLSCRGPLVEVEGKTRRQRLFKTVRSELNLQHNTIKILQAANLVVQNRQTSTASTPKSCQLQNTESNSSMSTATSTASVDAPLTTPSQSSTTPTTTADTNVTFSNADVVQALLSGTRASATGRARFLQILNLKVTELPPQLKDTLKSVIGPFWQGNFRTEVPIRETCAVLLARFLLQTASPRSLLIWSEYIAKVNARSTG
jgi:hypothetical protein